MKKVTTLGLLLCLWSVLSAYAQINLNLDIAGRMTYKHEDLSRSFDVNPGISPSIEFIAKTKNRLSPGFGLEIQLPRGFNEEGAGDDYSFNYIPIYGILKIKTSNIPNSPELIVNAGYNILTGSPAWRQGVSLKNGFCFGVGGALNMNKFVVSLLYKVNYGGAESNDYSGNTYTTEITYKHLSLSLGRRFG